MDENDSKTMYIMKEYQKERILNASLFFMFYFLFVIVVYQFIGRDSKNRTWKAYIILALIFLYPFIIHPFQKFIYNIGDKLFFMIYSKFYYNDK